MRYGCFEVILVDENDVPLYDHEEIFENGTYVGVQTGKTYAVKLNIYKDSVSNMFPAKYIRVGLYVDGVDVGYWKRVDMSNISSSDIIKSSSSSQYVSARFFGFRRNQDDIQSFVFAADTIRQSSEPIHNMNSIKPLGSIKVVFYEAKVEEGIFSNNIGVINHPVNTSYTISEGEKFLSHASITTAPGQLVDKKKEPFIPLQNWSNVSKTPLMMMTLNYHSMETMMLLEQLYKSSSYHQLSSSGNSKKRLHGLVDLTDDDHSISRRKISEVEEEEVQVLPLPPKIVAMLDFTADDEGEMPVLRYVALS